MEIDLGSSVKTPALGHGVRFERECAHKMVLTASGNYKCRRCLRMWDVVRPPIVESMAEAVTELKKGW